MGNCTFEKKHGVLFPRGGRKAGDDMVYGNDNGFYLTNIIRDYKSEHNA